MCADTPSTSVNVDTRTKEEKEQDINNGDPTGTQRRQAKTDEAAATHDARQAESAEMESKRPKANTGPESEAWNDKHFPGWREHDYKPPDGKPTEDDIARAERRRIARLPGLTDELVRDAASGQVQRIRRGQGRKASFLGGGSSSLLGGY